MPIVLRPQPKRVDGVNNPYKRLRSGNRVLGWDNKIVRLMALSMLILFLGIWSTVGAFVVTALTVAALFIGYMGLSFWQSHQWLEDVHALCETDEVGDVGVLLETLRAIRASDTSLLNTEQNVGAEHVFHETPVEQNVWEAIVRLLPRIEANEPHLLNEESRGILQEILTLARPYREPLQRYDRERSRMHLAIMQTLHKVGDSRDLPALQRVASGQVREIAIPVREAAKQAIAAIQARRSGEVTRQELLRAVQSPGYSHQELLRSAASAQETPKQELLRAVENKQNV
jgi:hypothetical protein